MHSFCVLLYVSVVHCFTASDLFHAKGATNAKTRRTFFHFYSVLEVEELMPGVVIKHRPSPPPWRGKEPARTTFSRAGVRLYFQKHFLLIQKIQEGPFYGNITKGRNNKTIRAPGQLGKPFKKSVRSIFPVNKMPRQVN